MGGISEMKGQKFFARKIFALDFERRILILYQFY